MKRPSAPVAPKLATTLAKPLVTGFAAPVGLCVLVLGALLLTGTLGAADTPPQRIPFQIATGASSGSFFPVGEAIAGLLSHPPGVARCDSAGVCGPVGLVVTAQTSDGAVDNLRAVNSGNVDSGLVQGDVLAAALKGRGIFRRDGKMSHVRVIAPLYVEPVHLVVAAKGKIHDVAGLRSKRVSLGSAGSGLDITAQEILSAWRVRGVKPVHADLFTAMRLMREGKLDAFFVRGAGPLPSLSDLFASGVGRLVPLDGPNRARLLKEVPSLSAAVIPAGTYGAVPAMATVSSSAVWIVRDSVPDALVYSLTRALFNPANRAGLAASHPDARAIPLAAAAMSLPAPLHPGAERFYREQGVAQH